MEENFIRFLDKHFPGDSPSSTILKWRKHELDGLQRAQTIVALLSQYLSLKGKTILDVGCGYGALAYTCSKEGASAIGIDCDRHRLDGANIRHLDHPGDMVEFIQSPAEYIPLRDSSVDLVFCNDVLEHVNSHFLILKEIGRIIKNDGLLYLSFPNRFSPLNLKTDPHYGLFGVSILPRKVGKWLVVDYQKITDEYTVGEFPIASRLIHILNQNGFIVIRWDPAPKKNVGILTPFLRFYRLNTQPIIIMLCKSCK